MFKLGPELTQFSICSFFTSSFSNILNFDHNHDHNELSSVILSKEYASIYNPISFHWINNVLYNLFYHCFIWNGLRVALNILKKSNNCFFLSVITIPTFFVLRYSSCGSSTTDALEFVQNTMFTANQGSRASAMHILIILTDGKLTRQVFFFLHILSFQIQKKKIDTST